MTTFTDQYTSLLIKQYWEKPKAKAEIAAIAARFESINDLGDAVAYAFDLDTAVGDQLDIIGKQVGIGRVLPVALPGETSLVMDDDDYRLFIRIKIAKNNASGLMVSDERITINDVLQLAFGGEAYAVDNKDMTLTLYIDEGIDEGLVEVMRQLDLLPRPMTVNYRLIVHIEIDGFFGFSNNPNALGFGDLTIVDDEGGGMAELVA